MCEVHTDRVNFLSNSSLLLVEEIQHRVANEYTLAVAFINAISKSVATRDRREVSRIAERLHRFAEVHHALLPISSDRPIDLYSYLETLCSALTRAILEDRGVSLVLHETSVAVDPERAWRVALIVSELITNAARHGRWLQERGVIEVRLAPYADDIQCWVYDNGGGSIDPSPGRGTRIIRELARELGGHFHRVCGTEGTLGLLTFPIAAPNRAGGGRNGVDRH